MQEEVEQRIVSLMISCGKLGEQEFRKAVAKLLEQLKNDYQKYQHGKANPHGKMTVKQLAAKDKGLQSIEVTDQNIGSFNRIVPFPVSWTVKMKKKQKETQDILSYHTQAAGCSDKARAKASGGRQPIEECGRTGL